MSIVKTTEDGWDCVPKLTEVAEKMDEVESFVYEIKHCVRETELEDMVVEMTEMFEDAIMILKKIDTEVEYETVDEED